jgi:hypothetical protein
MKNTLKYTDSEDNVIILTLKESLTSDEAIEVMVRMLYSMGYHHENILNAIASLYHEHSYEIKDD